MGAGLCAIFALHPFAMEPGPYFYASIDRNAILVRPRLPFIHWVNTLFEDETTLTDVDEGSIYLIREMRSNADVLEWVQHHYNKLFENELNDWCTDEALWPQDRTYAVFAAWFKVEVHSMVLDLEEGPITKE